MDPEIWIAVAAVFVSGGAIGSAGTLLSQWIVRKVDLAAGTSQRVVDAKEHDALQADVAALYRHLQNLDARLDFTERLLDGALPIAPPPSRLSAQPSEREATRDADGSSASRPG
jgi:hypothetical protein